MKIYYKNIKPMKTILMKVTSRERPEQLFNTVKKYVELANNPKYLIWCFTMDRDDTSCDMKTLLESLLLLIDNRGVAYVGESKNKIDAINRDVEDIKQKWDILCNVSDDQIPQVKGWDDEIRNKMPDNLDASLWFSDGCQPRLNTMEIVGLNYYKRFNYIYNPEYKSLFCDNEAHDVAVKLGKQIKMSNCIIKHFHPGHLAGIKTDALYQKNDKFWNEDQATYNRRKKLNFDL